MLITNCVFKMSLIANKDKIWSAKLNVEGSEYQYRLFDSMEFGLVLRPVFLEALLDLQKIHEHYKFSDCIRELFTPEGEDFTGYAAFMVLFRPSESERLERIYLFALRKDNTIQLLASNDDELTVDKFSDDIDKIILYPNNVESLLIAYIPTEKTE